MKTLLICGCARSGLTMTMQMLYKGGYPCIGDYPSFEGYGIGEIPFEKCNGKAIKVIDTQLQFPPSGDYHIIRLSRNIKEQAKSQLKFLKLLGIPANRSDLNKIEKSLINDYKKIDNWAKRQNGYITLRFEEILANPENIINELIDFTDFDLNKKAMASTVIKRGPECYNGMLESEIIKNFENEMDTKDYQKD